MNNKIVAKEQAISQEIFRPTTYDTLNDIYNLNLI